MMTLDTLNAYGANTGEGLGRCLNKEPFYLRMVALALADGNFDTIMVPRNLTTPPEKIVNVV